MEIYDIINKQILHAYKYLNTYSVQYEYSFLDDPNVEKDYMGLDLHIEGTNEIPIYNRNAKMKVEKLVYSDARKLLRFYIDETTAVSSVQALFQTFFTNEILTLLNTNKLHVKFIFFSRNIKNCWKYKAKKRAFEYSKQEILEMFKSYGITENISFTYI